jgi:hypothetical protein
MKQIFFITAGVAFLVVGFFNVFIVNENPGVPLGLAILAFAHSAE